ncbi:hypothetical protein [Saccharothrix stipae]
MTGVASGPRGSDILDSRRRNELEYPAFPGERIEPAEVHAAVRVAHTILDSSRQLVEHLPLFT